MSAPPPKPPAPPPPQPGAPPPAAAPTLGKPSPAAQFAQKPAAPPAAPVKEPTYGVMPVIPPKPQTTPVKEPTYGVIPVIPPKPQTTPAAPGAAAGGAKPPVREPTYLPLPAIAPKPQTTPVANAPVKEPTYGVIPYIPPKPGAPSAAQGGSNENKAAVAGGGGGQSKMAEVGGGGGGSTMAAVRRGASRGGQSNMRKAPSKGGQTQAAEGEAKGQGGNGDDAQKKAKEAASKPQKEAESAARKAALRQRRREVQATPIVAKIAEPGRKRAIRDLTQPAKTFEEIKPHRFFSYETEGIRNVYYQYSENFDKEQLEMMIDHDKKVVAEDLNRKREATKKMMKSNWRRPVWKERVCQERTEKRPFQLMQTMVFKIIYLMGLGMTLTFMTICLVHMGQSASEEFIGFGREDPTIWDLFMVDMEFDLKEGRISDAGWASASLLLAICIGFFIRVYWKEAKAKMLATSVQAEFRYSHCLALQEMRRGDMDTHFELKVRAQMGGLKKNKMVPGKIIGVKEAPPDI